MRNFGGYVKDTHYGDTVHISGCQGAIYRAGECSIACINATKNLKITQDEIKKLPSGIRPIFNGTGRGDSMG